MSDFSDEQIQKIAAMVYDEIQTEDWIATMDNKELLWRLLQTKFYTSCPSFGLDAQLCAAMERRLVPEYDGENMTLTERGWETPDGPINYK
jgi:hypothetical protein